MKTKLCITEQMKQHYKQEGVKCVSKTMGLIYQKHGLKSREA